MTTMTTPAERTLTALATHSRQSTAYSVTFEIFLKTACPDCDNGRQCYDYSGSTDETPTDRYATCPTCAGDGEIDEPAADFIERLCDGDTPEQIAQQAIAYAVAVLTALESAAGNIDAEVRGKLANERSRLAHHRAMAAIRSRR